MQSQLHNHLVFLSHKFKLYNMVCNICYVTRHIQQYATNPQILYCISYAASKPRLYNRHFYYVTIFMLNNNKYVLQHVPTWESRSESNSDTVTLTKGPFQVQVCEEAQGPHWHTGLQGTRTPLAHWASGPFRLLLLSISEHLTLFRSVSVSYQKVTVFAGASAHRQLGRVGTVTIAQ